VPEGRGVTLYEVGPRDGLQNEPEVLDAATRAELVRRLAATGLPAIEVASFVDPRRVPQMTDAEVVVAEAGELPGVVRAGLALNEKGYDRLLEAGLDEVRFSFGVTEEFNRRNQGASVESSLAAAAAIVDRARADGLRSTVILSVAFGCPFEGEVDPGRVAGIAERVGANAPDALVLGDTIGVASPSAVRALTEQVAGLGLRVGGHFHNTRNTGYANAVAALEAGATVLDASVGGLGGCPFAPNATGNVATEDLVYLLQREGVETGVDLDGLVAVAAWMAQTLGRRLEGQLYRAGAFPASSPG
jgi:hydroxymethylglutaryl-CoA lyase/(R)-citramalyl-CoA lyase